MACFRGGWDLLGFEPEAAAEAAPRGETGVDFPEVRAVLPERCEVDLLGMEQVLNRPDGDLLGLKKAKEQRRLAEAATPTRAKFAGRCWFSTRWARGHRHGCALHGGGAGRYGDERFGGSEEDEESMNTRRTSDAAVPKVELNG